MRLLRPSILQRNRAVENQFRVRAVLVQSEIGEALELITLFVFRVFQGRFQLGGDDFQRVRIERGLEIFLGTGGPAR